MYRKDSLVKAIIMFSMLSHISFRRGQEVGRTQTHAERVEVLQPRLPEDILHDIQVGFAQHLRDVNVAILAPGVPTALLAIQRDIIIRMQKLEHNSQICGKDLR